MPEKERIVNKFCMVFDLMTFTFLGKGGLPRETNK